MVRRLKWIAAVCFLALPVVGFLGGPIQKGCDPPLYGSCDPFIARPDWAIPVFWSLALIGTICLLFAFIVALRTDSDEDLV